MCIGAKINLTTNLWTQKDLVNGANGQIKDIIYPLDKEIDSLLTAILIEFEHYTGPRLFKENDHRYNWIPVNLFDG